MTPTPSPASQALREDTERAFVILKRDLYYRPNSMGYTGVLDEAGRYTEEEAHFHADHGNATYLRAADAPRFSSACWPETKTSVLEADIANLQSTLAAEQAARVEAEREREEARAALTKINAIRNSIIGLQTINWSEHIYPLVAALEAAGIEGMDYPEARKNFGTMLDRTNAAEAALATAAEENAKLRAALEAAATRLVDIAAGNAFQPRPHAATGATEALAALTPKDPADV